MRACATYEDVNLILRLYELRRETRLRDARRWFVKNFHAKTLDEFDKLCPRGSEPNESYRMVTTYWEMTASFITSGVLNPELFFESGRELLLCWVRIRDVVAEQRKANSDPAAYRNLETAAGRFVAWWEDRAPGAYEAFVKRVTAP